MAQSDQNRRKNINTLLIVMVGQVGFLTLAIILASVFGGLWLDKTFGTKPLFTLILLLAGIPLSVVLMLFAARKAVAKIESNAEAEKHVSA